MSFPTVIFGRYEIGVGFTDGTSIPTGGLRVFIVPTINIGPNPLDIGITYIDQFGNVDTTGVTTSVAAGTTSGTHIQMTLNAGDSGIRDITNVTSIGGSVGDRFNLESWNEGLGRLAYSLSKSDPNPIHISIEPTKYIGLSRIYTQNKLVPNFYPAPNPRIQRPVPLNKMCPRQTPGYPNPLDSDPLCIGGSHISIYLSNIQHIAKTYPYVLLCTRMTPGYPSVFCPGGDYVSLPLSGRQHIIKSFLLFKSWLESVVGQVLSGYVTNIQNEIILKAVSIVITSTGRSEFNQVGNVNPATGFYQIFAKSVIYDKRYLIIQLDLTKTVALPGAGNYPLIDGTTKLPTPYNLQFACPVISCDFNITRNV
jgi:hypothetical protein